MNNRFKIIGVLFSLLVSACGGSAPDSSSEPNKAPQQINQEVNTSDHIPDVPSNFEFEVESDHVLNNKNLYYNVLVTYENENGEEDYVVLGVEEKNNHYNVYARDPYQERVVYHLSLSEGISLYGYDPSIREFTFATEIEEKSEIVLKEGLQCLPNSAIVSNHYEEGYLVLDKNYNFQEGDVVLFDPDGLLSTLEGDSSSYKVTSAPNGKAINNALYVTAPEPNEVYEALDVYQKSNVDVDNIDLDNVDFDEVKKQVENTTFYKSFVYALSTYENSKPSTSVKVDISKNIGVGVKLSKENGGVVATITLTFKGNIKNIGELSLSIEIKPKVSFSTTASASLGFFKINFDFALHTTLQTPIKFIISLEGKIDIKDIEKGILEKMSEFNEKAFYNDLMYLDKLENKIKIPIFHCVPYKIPYTPLMVGLDIDFTIDLTMKIELAFEFDYVVKQTVGIRTGSSGLETYKYRDQEFSLEKISLSGELSVKAGIEISLILYVICLKNEIYISLDLFFGVYGKLVGEITWEKGEDWNSSIYLEFGLFIDFSIPYKVFAWKGKLFSVGATLPLFTIGIDTRLFGFVEDESTFKAEKRRTYLDRSLVQLANVKVLEWKLSTFYTDFSEFDFVPESSEVTVNNTTGQVRFENNAPNGTYKINVIYKKKPQFTKVINVEYENKEASVDLFIDEAGVTYYVDKDNKVAKLLSAPSSLAGTYEVLPIVNNYPVKLIDDLSFYGCDKLQKVIIPDSVTQIGASAFDGCSSLKELNLNKVTTIGDKAFNNCKSLKTVELSCNVPDLCFSSCSSLANVILKDGIEEIGRNAFDGCALIGLTIPSTVKKIGGQAFASNKSLSGVHFAGSGAKIEGEPFFNCTNLKCIAVPSDAIKVYGKAFYGLGFEIISEEKVEDNFFYAVTSNGYEIACYFGNDEKVEVPSAFKGEEITSIGSYAFGTGVKEIELPASIINVSSNAFFECKDLTILKLNSTNPPKVTGTSLDVTNRSLSIYVPNESYYNYISSPWMFYSNLLTAY